MIIKWDTIEKREIADYKIFKAMQVRRRHPVWNKESEFVILNSPNWVNIIPVTKNNEILLIEQYRQGTDSITLEIPGGLIENGEQPIDAAKRECIEETGYASSEDLILTGVSFPNPAFLTNQCFSYAWMDVENIYEQHFDIDEDICVIPTPIPEVKKLIIDGQINHSVILTAFFYFFLKFGY
ncbi:MAG TPA: NUDIX hydrolase [Candidatus Kapabacteria bacterium]|jgi:8-oxo-dGTP pyrophosphatase MutT (NUDIX family)|nr:NUDIX hydrolase [Candidatus Kapabacteria bacterium]HOV92657.1 NUDIX hydrolase [Candidatus Kapabacteria bacterium]